MKLEGPLSLFGDNFLSEIFALRCWTSGDKEKYQEFYKKISNYLKRVDLPYFVDFEFIHDGIFVNEKTWPITRMKWAAGETLHEFIEQYIDQDSDILKAAAVEFQKMVAALHKHQVSHGDLQHGNILFNQHPETDDIEIKLIDYDSLWVPTLGDGPQTTFGLPDYQHPIRMKGGKILNEKVDYFSELVIYLSLLSLAEKPALWHQFKDTRNGLLFSKADFKDPDDSDIFSVLESLSMDVRHLAHTLKDFCKETDVNQLAPLEDVLPKTGLNPRFHYNFAKYLKHQGEYDQAIISYQRAIYCNHDFKDAHHDLGLAYLEQEEYAKATIPFHKVITLDPTFKEVYCSLGQAYLKLEKLEAALGTTEEVLKYKHDFQPARQLLEKIKNAYYDQGMTYFNALQYNEAISEFQNALKIDPGFKRGFFSLGLAYFELGNLRAAEKAVKKALQIEPSFRPAQTLLQDIKYADGTFFLDQEQYNKAIAAFEAAINLGLDSKEIHHYLGFTYFKLGNLQAAEKATREALWTNPTYQPSQDLLRDIKYAYHEHGIALQNNRQYDEAVTAFEAAIAVDPGFKEAYRDLVLLYVKLGNLHKAEKAVKKALKVDSEDHITHNLLEQIKLKYHELGVVYLNNRQCSKAVKAFKAAIALDPNFKEVYRGLGLAYFELGNLQAAEKAARDALGIDKTYTLVFWLLGAIKQAYYTRGLDSMKNNQYAQASHQFQEAIRIDPKFIEAHCNLGAAYLKLGKLEEAKKETNKVLSLDSDYQPVCELLEELKDRYRKRGINYWKMGAYAKAVDVYQQAIDIDPNFKEAHYNLGIACWNLREYAKAVDAYQQALDIDPNFRDAYYNLGATYFQQRQYSKAVDAYQHAVDIDPNFGDAYYSLGLTYFKMDKFQKAREALEKVLKLDSNYQPALRLLEKVNGDLVQPLSI